MHIGSSFRNVANGRRLEGTSIRVDLGLGDEEADAYRAAVALDPNLSIAWYRLGNHLSLKREWTSYRHYETRQEARDDIIEYIEMFYNSNRKHSYLGYLSPNEYEEFDRVA